jgi:hypothetical protein
MSEEVTKDFCDERCGNIHSTVDSLRKDINRVFWTIVGSVTVLFLEKLFGPVLGKAVTMACSFVSRG